MLRPTLLVRSFARAFHATRTLNLNPKNVEEVRIPVPWGHIAGKWWGDRNVQPILAVHGLLDNCASFDELLPLLDVPAVLAIDLPGHGQSSHAAPGLTNDFKHVLVCIRYVVNQHFKWPYVDFLSHSFGSCSAFAYSGLFPKHVRKYVSLDCARFNMATRSDLSPTFLQIAVQSTMDAEEYENTPVPFEEHLTNFMDVRRDKGGSLTEKSSRILLARNLQRNESGDFADNVDPRLPMYSGLLPESTLNELASRITCELLSVRFTDGVLRGVRKEQYEKQIDMMRKTSKNLIAVEIDGNHHAHLEDPKCVASLINDMLTQT